MKNNNPIHIHTVSNPHRLSHSSTEPGGFGIGSWVWPFSDMCLQNMSISSQIMKPTSRTRRRRNTDVFCVEVILTQTNSRCATHRCSDLKLELDSNRSSLYSCKSLYLNDQTFCCSQYTHLLIRICLNHISYSILNSTAIILPPSPLPSFLLRLYLPRCDTRGVESQWLQ